VIISILAKIANMERDARPLAEKVITFS